MPSGERDLRLPTPEDGNVRTRIVQPAKKEGQQPRCSQVFGIHPLPTGADSPGDLPESVQAR